MRERIVPYTFALLLATVLSLLPPAIFADLIVPFDSWENWYGRDQAHARPRFTGSNLPPVLKAEVAVFKTLAAPPGWLREKVTGYPTVYAGSLGGRGIIHETGGVPPFAFAISHLSWAVPLWFMVTVAFYELAHIVRSRTMRRSSVS
jgi:hypothetical protein